MPESAANFDQARALADKIAGAYQNTPGVALGDLRVVAHAALQRACVAYDPGRGLLKRTRPVPHGLTAATGTSISRR
jgi:hypothetical protein